MKNKNIFLLLITFFVANLYSQEANEEQLKSLLSKSENGICVLMGIPDNFENKFSDLVKIKKWSFYVQSPNEEKVFALRKWAEKSDFLGKRFFIDSGDYDSIKLGNNLAGVIFLYPSALKKTLESELVRVLHPEGTAFLGEKKIIKSFPEGIDEWTHPYHGPNNNQVSEDKLAKGSFELQYISYPRFAPIPQVTVTAGGKIYRAFGHFSPHAYTASLTNTLIATNAYNGTLLWKKELTDGFMIHRSTMVASKDGLYLADNESCKFIDSNTGEIKHELFFNSDPKNKVWKWLAIKDGVLFGLLGEEEITEDERLCNWGGVGGWGWGMYSRGYPKRRKPKVLYPWSQGKKMIAWDINKKELSWDILTKDNVDGRAVCILKDCIYYYSPQKSIECRNIKTGELVWSTDDKEVLSAIGGDIKAQSPGTGFPGICYMRAFNDKLYFSGTQRKELTVLSAKDGKLLWTKKNRGQSHIILKKEGVYAVGSASSLLEHDSGKTIKRLENLKTLGCVKTTANVESIFTRFLGVGVFDIATQKIKRMPSFRPPCNDGTVTANGMLLFGTWICQCNVSFYGTAALAAQSLSLTNIKPIINKLIKTKNKILKEVTGTEDWATYRKNNIRSAMTKVDMPKEVEIKWRYEIKSNLPTAPVIAYDTVFISDDTGVTHAIDIKEGKNKFKHYSGASILFPPTIKDNQLFVGSGDGKVYCLDAIKGDLLWSFLLAPNGSKIPFYNKIISKWPVTSGVLVEDGIAYAAAGLTNSTGTRVVALDVKTGETKWENNSSGDLGSEFGTGVVVSGHMLFNKDKLYLAGGSVISPAIYDSKTGKCLSTIKTLEQASSDNLPKFPYKKKAQRRDIYLKNDMVVPIGAMLHNPQGKFTFNFYGEAFSDDFSLSSLGKTHRPKKITLTNRATKEQKWVSELEFNDIQALVLTNNATLILEANKLTPKLTALDIETGKLLWEQHLPSMPVIWGIAVSKTGNIILTLLDGSVVCIGSK